MQKFEVGDEVVLKDDVIKAYICNDYISSDKIEKGNLGIVKDYYKYNDSYRVFIILKDYDIYVSGKYLARSFDLSFEQKGFLKGLLAIGYTEISKENGTLYCWKEGSCQAIDIKDFSIRDGERYYINEILWWGFKNET